MTTHAKITHAVLIAAALMLPLSAHSQNMAGGLPPWTDSGRREAMFPPTEWLTGFSSDVIGRGVNLADLQRRVENEARQQLAMGITSNIQATSESGTLSDRTVAADGSARETLQRTYNQMILASTSAEVGRIELSTFHDEAGNRYFAFARVRKADLAAYYVSRIEFFLQLADNELTLARQFIGEDRRRSAQEKMEEARRHLADSRRYNDLLSAVDFRGDVSRLLSRASGYQQTITQLEAQLRESPPIFITGTETANGRQVDVMVSALQHRFTENGCRVTTQRAGAGFVLTVNAQSCNTTTEGRFSFCYACVRATLTNAQTGQTEATINFTGPKEGWRDLDRACDIAFRNSVDRLWTELGRSTEVCR